MFTQSLLQVWIESEIVCYLAGYDKIFTSIEIRNFRTWAIVPPEQRVASSSSQHGGEDGCTLSLCCKFELNLRLFAFLLAGDDKIYAFDSMMNLGVQLFYCHQPDSKWSQIDFKFAIQTEWTSSCITMLWGRASFSLLRYQGSPNLEFRVFIAVIYFIVTSQIANNLRLISNLQYWLSGHPPSSPCYEGELASLFSDGRAAWTWIIRIFTK